MNKKNKFSIFSFCLLIVLILSSCSSITKTETRDVVGFQQVSIGTFGEVIIEQGDEESLTIEGPSNYLRYLTTEVDNGILNIDARRGFIGTPVRKVTYWLKVKDLNAVTLSGAGSIKIYALETGTLQVNLSGAGSIEVDDLQADKLEVLLSSAGAIVVAGEVNSQEITISGVGSYESGDLLSNTASVAMNGAGSAVLWVLDELDVEVTGIGSVSYYGSPQVSQNISGLGSVNSKGEHY